MMDEIYSLADLFNTNPIEPMGLSFIGNNVTLNSVADAGEIISGINNCDRLDFLKLEGYTFKNESAQAIANSLSNHAELNIASLKDIVRVRSKEETTLVLEYFTEGLLKANVHLCELDLSDNSYGPIGVEGLASLLRSTCCYTLTTLRITNNALGSSGAKIVGNALLENHEACKAAGNALAIEVFAAGNNRLDNPGTVAFAKVFYEIETLKEIYLPQNGIYRKGMLALAKAFIRNPHLQNINLNDNVIGPNGSEVLAKVLTKMYELRVIDLGDCLLRSNGSLLVATSLASLPSIEEVSLQYNSIRIEAGLDIIAIFASCGTLKKVSLNGNGFGEEGCNRIKEVSITNGLSDKLGTLSDDEGAGSSSDEDYEVDISVELICNQESSDEEQDSIENAFQDDDEAFLAFLTSVEASKQESGDVLRDSDAATDDEIEA